MQALHNLSSSRTTPLGYRATIYAHDAAGSVLAGLPLRARTTRIGYNAAIAMNATVMPVVHVGNNSAVMPGAIITKEVEEGTVAGGKPATLRMTDIINHWHDGTRKHPEQYCDHPSFTRPPTTPWEDIITWLYGVIYRG